MAANTNFWLLSTRKRAMTVSVHVIVETDAEILQCFPPHI